MEEACSSELGLVKASLCLSPPPVSKDPKSEVSQGCPASSKRIVALHGKGMHVIQILFFSFSISDVSWMLIRLRRHIEKENGKVRC